VGRLLAGGLLGQGHSGRIVGFAAGFEGPGQGFRLEIGAPWCGGCGCWIGGEKIGKRWGGVGGGGREDAVAERFRTLMWRFSFCFFRSSRWRIEVAKAVIKGGEFVLFACSRSIHFVF
jgi:hypothetical protein